MPDPIISSTEPTAAGTPVPVAPAKPELSLIERVAQFKPEVKPQEPTPQPSDVFNLKEIESIKDPIARTTAERAYKSMQSDYTKKTQEVAEEKRKLAEQKKELEAKTTQANQKPVWTAERIQSELLNDPTFVAEAQRIAQANPAPSNPSASGLSDDQWSALSSEEKAKFNLMEQKVAELEQLSKQSKQQAQVAAVQSQHQALKSKFANYNSDIVDTTVRDIVDGKVQIGLEQIWKALDYEASVNRAYELGKLDAAGKQKERIGNMSYDGGQVAGAPSTAEPGKNESGQAFFRRLAIARIAENAAGRK
jgi:hypothetical protein